MNEKCFAQGAAPRHAAQSVIADTLIESYQSANYQIGTGPEALVVRINQYSQSLADLLNRFNRSCAAIITAYNPYSQPLSEAANAAAHKLLQNWLTGSLHPVIESLNTDSSEQWPAEKGFFVLGLDLDTARFLGRKFKQNAIVWIGNTAIPRLILLR